MKVTRRVAITLAGLCAVGAVACFASAHSFGNPGPIYVLGGTLAFATVWLGWMHWLAGGNFRDW